MARIGGLNGNAPVTCVAGPSGTLSSIEVTPANSTLNAFQTPNLTAIGHYTSGDFDLTDFVQWESDNEQVVRFWPPALVGLGTATVRARLDGLAGSAQVEVATIGAEFKAGFVTSVGDTPKTLVTADFNGDGDQDVLACRAMVLGNGDGTFGFQSGGTDTTLGFSQALGDFNEDGKPDVVDGTPSGNVTLRLGRGDGTFTNSGLSLGFRPQDLNVADLNEDGHDDVVLVGEGMLAVRLGNGDGTFQAVSSFAATSGRQVTFADVTGDTELDAVVSCTTTVARPMAQTAPAQQGAAARLPAGLGRAQEVRPGVQCCLSHGFRKR